MKILFVLEHFYPYVGGSEELFLNLTTSLVNEGYEITVVTTLHDKSLQKYESYKGIDICRVNCHNRFLFTLLSIPTILRKTSFADYIHTTSYNSAIPSVIAGLVFGKKVIITFHEVWGRLWLKMPFTPKWQLIAYWLFEWFILKLPFYKYVAVSKSTRNNLINNGISSSKIELIYNGLDYDSLNSFHFTPPNTFTCCYFGRLGISKGIDLLLKAFGMLILKHPDAKLKLIIPTYPQKLFNKVMKLINQARVGDNIILLNNLSRSDLLKEASHSSCVIVPSISEGFCFVAAESVAMGMPLISSDKGSLPEVVGGKCIIINKLDVEGVYNALEKAYCEEWTYTAPSKFHLKQSVLSYLKLYQNKKISE
jgi:glycosyltransferase involved in cell wall biosynthesis